MSYQLVIPKPKCCKIRKTAIPLNCLSIPDESSSNCDKGLRGMYTSCHAWIGSTLINPECSIYWRGNLARSWVVHYLRHYHRVSDHFLSHEVGISDIGNVVSSLKGGEFKLPIIAENGATTTNQDNVVKCVWYSLDESQLRGGDSWNQIA